MYSYIQSRFYRAPEVLLEMPFGQPMDLWGLGCIICELYSGKPLFEGNNSEEMINLIQALIGPVPPAMIVQSKVKNDIFIQNDVKSKGLQSIIDQNAYSTYNSCKQHNNYYNGTQTNGQAPKPCSNQHKTNSNGKKQQNTKSR
ncbi:Kinase [Hexamita inflata]|uniref:CMGC DYRK n=1 Tax=Hexamita inflata TaxID=28002 RepID=A0AA86PM75_9EUKA|nr:CMGC DYRK [Hexamita inflata]